MTPRNPPDLGCYYNDGEKGLPQDYKKGECSVASGRRAWLRHGSFQNVGNNYLKGEGVEKREMKKAKYFWELAAMGGDTEARFNLGAFEVNEQVNMVRTMEALDDCSVGWI